MSDSDQYTLIPYQKLSKDALHGVLEEFINREGTDYGLIEVSFDDKCEQVMAQIKQGQVLIVFDHDSQSAGLMLKEELGQFL
ncbi:cytoplasmic protein [Bermanella sp. 47_1433_sub80_T6]|nr:cytoplasmic protein [Bermanella sp. 47_1433_sub80_T6]